MQGIVESTAYLPDEAATLAFAERFAAAVVSPCSVALIGDLGAGKTTFVRGVLRALGVKGAIKSPTYALVESYGTTKGEVHHLDAYRIESVEDFEARGGFEYFESPSIRFVEWPERLPGAVLFDVELRFDFENDGRRVTVSPLPPGGGGAGGEGDGGSQSHDGSTPPPPPLPRGEREPNP
jgi:tRNA threonylcarbamoyladenosine biosynthesis protein TsaE